MNLIPWRKKHTIPVARDPSFRLPLSEHSFPAPLSEFRHEVDRLFERFFRGAWQEPGEWQTGLDWPTGEFMPSIDVAESDNQITIRAELPGMTPDDVDINISGNVLTIHGEKRESTEDKGDDYYHCERRFGAFTRNIELPTTADLDDIDAEQCNGVLTILVKKLATAKTSKIAVKPSGREMAGTEA